MSELHLHHLRGCAPAPLAHYLKALGILRLVSEQKDRDARGWWQDEHFCLLSVLDKAALERFFLEEYAPSPFVAPWNKGSGFFLKGDPGLSPIEASTAPRFEPFRKGVRAAREQILKLAEADAGVRALKERTKARKDMSPAEAAAARRLKGDPEFKKELAAAERAFKALKADLFGGLLLAWRGPHRTWLDASVVVVESGEARFPSLLGTGGNDGRLDFTNNAMQRLGDLFDLSAPLAGPRARARPLLSEALWADPTKETASGAAVGQFLPGGAGGANMSSGTEGESGVNPWDFVLMLEGALCLTSRATRRLDPRASSFASAPFAVRAQGAGFPSAGDDTDARGEQWMPLWPRPATLQDLEAMLGEARLQIGRDRARHPLDAARAIARLGVARGVSSYTRFGFLERNGQSNLAVPLARIDVRERPESHLIDDLAAWMERLRRLARDRNAPSRLVLAERRLADSVLAALTHDASPDRWQAVLLAAVEIECIQAAGTAIEAGPIPPLSPEWLEACRDGSAEWRLARALGGAAADVRGSGREDPVRAHWIPLDPTGRRFQVRERRLVRDARVVATGRDPVSDLGALVERRILEAAQAGSRALPLVAPAGLEADPADLAALIAGAIDLERAVALARAFMAVRWQLPAGRSPRPSVRGAWPEESWCAIRLAALPWPLDAERRIPVDAALVRRLRAGDGAGALEVALRRLRAAGLRPPLRAAALDPAVARLYAASLAFPIAPRDARRLARAFEPATAS